MNRFMAYSVIYLIYYLAVDSVICMDRDIEENRRPICNMDHTINENGGPICFVPCLDEDNRPLDLTVLRDKDGNIDLSGFLNNDGTYDIDKLREIVPRLTIKCEPAGTVDAADTTAAEYNSSDELDGYRVVSVKNLNGNDYDEKMAVKFSDAVGAIVFSGKKSLSVPDSPTDNPLWIVCADVVRRKRGGKKVALSYSLIENIYTVIEFENEEDAIEFYDQLSHRLPALVPWPDGSV